MKILKTLRGHTSEISILTMSTNNKYIASSCENGIVRIWAFPTGECLAVLLENFDKEITSLSVEEENMSFEGNLYIILNIQNILYYE